LFRWAISTLFQVKLLYAGFVGGNGSTLNADTVFFDGIGCNQWSLGRRSIAVLDTQIVIFNIDIQIRKNQFFFDKRPDNTSHFVAVEFDDRICNFYLYHDQR
jgi:hypothetical protein